jgi:hypothetical protein
LERTVLDCTATKVARKMGQMNRQGCSRNNRKRDRVTAKQSVSRSDAVMEQHDDFKERPYFVAVRAKLGEALRERHDLMEPLAPGLLELLAQLDTSIHVRQKTEAKLYAEIDECVSAMVCAAKRKPSEPEGG